MGTEHTGPVRIKSSGTEWDPKSERFVNNTLANALLDRPMREPWGSVYKELVAELL